MSLATKYKRVRYGKELLAEEGTILKAQVTGLSWTVIEVTEGKLLASGSETNVFRRNKAVKQSLMALGVQFAEETRVSKLEKFLTTASSTDASRAV